VAATSGRFRRALHVARVARRGRLFRVLREIGVVGSAPATREGAREFRLALEELGTTYSKLGQLLSSRSDLLPDVYIEELSQLVDQAPPVPFSEIEPIIRGELDRDLFVEIDPEPMATASIAQLHRGLLANGREVAIKVQLPGIVERVEQDLSLIRSTARLLDKHSEAAQLVQVEALADELEVHLLGELDFEEEAHNSDVIRSFLVDNELLVVPEVIRPYVTKKVLVLELIHGEKVSLNHGLAPERAAELARELFRFYVRQVTLEGVYHADPHRGNVLITADGRLALLDFGLLGRLDDDTRRSLALLLLSVAQNRAEDVADQILGLSLTTLGSDEPSFVHDLRRKLPRYHWRPLKDIQAGEALADLQRISLKYGIRLPPAFALVGKTLSQADSIARALDPGLDPIALIEDDTLDVMREEAKRRLEPRSLATFAYTQLDAVARLPRRVATAVDRLEAGTLKVGIVPTDLADAEAVLRSAANRIGGAMIIVGLLVSSALMAQVSHTIAAIGFGLSFLLGLYMLWKIIRTPGSL
jgi:predicted unusual protein kinase regulating ubiquinone biosynthesis (AarF/ABC1/UbiB family)